MLRIKDKIRQSLQASEELYHRLVLLVGRPGTGKTAALNDLATDLGVPVINVNLELSSRLLALNKKQRALHTPKLLGEIISAQSALVMLDNLEILFEPELMQDPLRLLKGLSRNQSVVATWNGSVDGGKLIYAENGHPEFRSYDLGDTLIVDANSVTPADTR